MGFPAWVEIAIHGCVGIGLLPYACLQRMLIPRAQLQSQLRNSTSSQNDESWQETATMAGASAHQERASC